MNLRRLAFALAAPESPPLESDRLWWRKPFRRDDPFWVQVVADLRWSFARPWHWFSGIAINLVLSVLFLVVVPLTRGHHQDWAVTVGTYFAVFILADVTTTNVLGCDARRVAWSLAANVSTLRLLLIKNVTLLIVVGVPTLLATAIITITREPDDRVAVTLPAVLFPILTWLGVGNLVSVLLPVAPQPLRRRWAERRDLRRTARWGGHLALPYVLYYLVSPIGQLPRLLRRVLPVSGLSGRGWVLGGSGIALWALGTVLALVLTRWRPIAFDDVC